VLKRLFDIFFSFFGLLLLSPFFVLIGILVFIDSGFPVFYLQSRVGCYNKDFFLFKFRTMLVNSDKQGLLTIGGKDNRVTKIGYYLRKYKIDELPQLINVLIGDMSLVGPRPEVRKYVDMYSAEQQKVLEIKPGITDYASIEYVNENEILGKSDNPEVDYIHKIMPAKLALNLKYVRENNLLSDIKIIFKTIIKVIK
jgi:lipopolysaccharide/colanic/teichoic acid biosynthesis glycosyltransferase